MMERARLYLSDVFDALARRGLLAWLPDVPFLMVQYFLHLGRLLNLKHPRLYNEKLQWIKLYDRKPEYPRYVDKLAVRDYVKEKVGEKYLIPLLATAESAEDIDWNALPERFVVKCTHGSSSNIICRDKSVLDTCEATEKLRNWMKRSWYPLSREWPYLGIAPRIIVEEFLGDAEGKVPYDYKILCFGGEPKYIIVDAERYTGHRRNFYDTQWNRQDMFNRHPPYEGTVEKPKCLLEMLDVARKLSEGIPHIRVDLYVVDDRVYFGEMTFFHGFGMEVFRPRAFEEHLGDLIRLPERTGSI
ncbi:MAG: ATP-grasp fold amidoligase family protein [Christensenellales bacterium]|jgi:hypothetical protein